MGIRSTLSSILSAPLAAMVESRVRKTAADVLDRADLADPATLRDLVGQVDQARRAVDGLASDIRIVRDAVAAMNVDDEEIDAGDDVMLRVAGLAESDRSLQDQLSATQARLAAVSADVVTLRKALDATTARLAETTALAESASATAAPARKTAASDKPSKAAPVAPVVSDVEPRPASSNDRGCAVPDCTGQHRARGFCGKHYQMWKRSTLPGFVDADGTVFIDADGPRYTVDTGLAGQPADIRRGKVYVQGKAVTAARQDA